MSRRKIESPSIGSTEELRQMDTNSSERKSVFERLGRITRTIDTNRRVVTTRNDYEEMDLRLKMDRKRRNPVVSPNRSLSPQSRPQQSSVKSLSHKSDDNNKVKSLVLAPNRRSESPKTHSQSVTSSSNSSSVKRSKLSSISLSNEHKFVINKWEDDIDDEELEKKRLQLQRELQELEISGSLEHREKSDCLPLTLTVSEIRSRSSSILSSESGSYSSSTIKSFSKTESSCSDNTDKKSNIKSTNKEQNVSSNKSISSEKKTHVSSSISRKESNLDLDSSHKKSDILKFDRHGNVRVSLDEQERQKRLRAERFSEKKSSSIDVSKKKSLVDSNSSKSEQKSVSPRDHSYSPPAKRARETTSKGKSNTERHRESSDTLKVERNDDIRKDDYKNKSDSRSNKFEFSPRSRGSETGDSRKSKYKDEVKNTGSERSSLLSGSPNYLERRDHSRDSRLSDRDNLSVTSRHDRRKGDVYSRDQSPAHSSHSKISRDSSISSDFSRKSKSERLSIPSQDRSTHSQNVELKNIEVKVSDPIIEEMSPISADSSIPDVTEIDSPKVESNISIVKGEESPISDRSGAKNEDESDDNFSDWSEGEDELLLQTEGFETLDEAANVSEMEPEKDSLNDEKFDIKSKYDSSNAYPTHSKDDALEAISDDELDAIIGETEPIDSTLDTKKSNSSKQMLDALDIDWGSLVSEPKTKLEFIPGSARKRFTPANVLMRIGFSQAFAGPLMTQKIINFCQNELKEDFVPFRHPMAAVHSLINDRIKERRFLFQVDSHSTALSGRKDLQIRKMLNKSSLKIFDNNITTTTTTSTTTPTSVNDLSISSTNVRDINASDIQCY